jgi:hypothetical protein
MPAPLLSKLGPMTRDKLGCEGYSQTGQIFLNFLKEIKVFIPKNFPFEGCACIWRESSNSKENELSQVSTDVMNKVTSHF